MPKFEVDYDEGLAQYDHAIEAAEQEIIDRGLPISSKPLSADGNFAEFPTIPPDLSMVSFPELQRLIGQFTAWFSFAIGQLKLTEGYRNAAEKQRAFAWSSIRRLKSGTVSDKDDAVRTDRRYTKVDAKYEHCDAKVRVYGAIVEGLKRDIETISRAASVLEARTGVEGRGIALNRKSRAATTQKSFNSGRRYPERNQGLNMFGKRNRGR